MRGVDTYSSISTRAWPRQKTHKSCPSGSSMGPSQTPQIMMDIVVLTGMLEGEKIIHLFYKENPLIRRGIQGEKLLTCCMKEKDSEEMAPSYIRGGVPPKCARLNASGYCNARALFNKASVFQEKGVSPKCQLLTRRDVERPKLIENHEVMISVITPCLILNIQTCFDFI